jgi:hypothetical protein
MASTSYLFKHLGIPSGTHMLGPCRRATGPIHACIKLVSDTINMSDYQTGASINIIGGRTSYMSKFAESGLPCACVK